MVTNRRTPKVRTNYELDLKSDTKRVEVNRGKKTTHKFYGIDEKEKRRTQKTVSTILTRKEDYRLLTLGEETGPYKGNIA